MRVLSALLAVVAVGALCTATSCQKKEAAKEQPAAPVVAASAAPAASAVGGGQAGGGHNADRPEGERPERANVAANVGVIIDGKPAPDWTAESFGKVKTIAVEGDGGEGKRDAWSVRDLARDLVGPNAVVTRIVGEDGQLDLTPAAWKNPAQVPILRVNRRGILRFQWVDGALAPAGGDELRGVTMIQISSK